MGCTAIPTPDTLLCYSMHGMATSASLCRESFNMLQTPSMVFRFYRLNMEKVNEDRLFEYLQTQHCVAIPCPNKTAF